MPHTSTDTICAPFANALSQTLHQLDLAIEAVAQDHYTTNAGPAFANATIGMHVRHALDHVRSLTTACTPEHQPSTPITLNYDTRDRGTTIEGSLLAARNELHQLRNSCQSLASLRADSPVVVETLPSRDTAPAMVESTLAREFAFVLSHTIHHNAIIRAMAVSLGARVDTMLGHAPSTPVRTSSCAQ